MDKKWIEKEINRLDRLSNKNLMAYQETGNQRYYRTYQNAEDTADVFRIALEKLDDHNELGGLRADVCHAAVKAEKALESKSAGEMRSALKEILAVARMRNIYDGGKKA